MCCVVFFVCVFEKVKDYGEDGLATRLLEEAAARQGKDGEEGLV